MFIYILGNFLVVCLLILTIHRKLIQQVWLYKKQSIELMQEMIEHSIDHRKTFQEMISRVHHQGIVPISASALGLVYLISLEVGRSIALLETLQKEEDWKTFHVSSELLKLIDTELTMLELKLRELNFEVKKVVNEYDKHQQENNWK